MRLTDLVLCFPPIILALAIAAALGIGTTTTIIAMLVVWWPKFARLARSLVLVQRSQEYVEAAVVLGLSPARILMRHIMPNSVGPLIVLVTLDVGNAIITFAGLSFLGLGVIPPTPEWGSMVSEGRELIEQWWVAAFPGLAILTVVLGFNFLGDGVAMVFQAPMTSLNPVLRIARQLVETMRAHGRFSDKDATRRAVLLLGRMGITAPERAISSYPHQFSGGMRQRVMLAMGFSNEPSLLIADEPTTALDVTIQAQILELIAELNRDFGAAIILISHALGVIANVCRRVIVMYAGEVVEEGPTEQVLADPRHPYTWALINAVPRIDRHLPGTRRLTTIEGAPPDPLAIPSGCRFAARCPFRIARCDAHPELTHVAPGRTARCWVTQA